MSLRDFLFYEEPGITLYRGDCREILPQLIADTVITDPIWPNAHPELVRNGESPYALFLDAMRLLPASVARLVVWLGCQSDPRFLFPVPGHLPFLRACYLRRAVPSYNGRCLVTGDVAYCFGAWPESREGRRVLPGEFSTTSIPSLAEDHPAHRSEAHARWLMKWWGDGITCDPFAGTGTTLVAAKAAGVPCIGVEIEPRYCEIAVKRLRQQILELTPPDPKDVQQEAFRL